MYCFNKDSELTDVGGGIERKVLAHNKEMMAVEVHFKKGAIGAMHSHPHVQISYVLSGKFEANIGGDVRIIAQGDTYYTAPDLPHGVVCLEDGVLLDIFTPQRDDFIK